MKVAYTIRDAIVISFFSGLVHFHTFLGNKIAAITFCLFPGKNASFLRLIRGRSLAEEYRPSATKASELGSLASVVCLFVAKRNWVVESSFLEG